MSSGRPVSFICSYTCFYFSVKRCKSVYRFDGKDSSELSFQVGEIIEVHKISEVGWWKGHLDGKCGWFPSSYVMVCVWHYHLH